MTSELILESRSLWGTTENQFLQRRCTLVARYLLLFWSMSPLGGQASLRSLNRSDRVTRNVTALRYLYTGPYATHLSSGRLRVGLSALSVLAVLEAIEQMQAAPRDTWGNVRVPRLDRLPGFHSVPRRMALRPKDHSPRAADVAV
jgi:hypothetical protein